MSLQIPVRVKLQHYSWEWWQTPWVVLEDLQANFVSRLEGTLKDHLSQILIITSSSGKRNALMRHSQCTRCHIYHQFPFSSPCVLFPVSLVYTQHRNCGNDMCLQLAYISRFRNLNWQHKPVTKFFCLLSQSRSPSEQNYMCLLNEILKWEYRNNITAFKSFWLKALTVYSGGELYYFHTSKLSGPIQKSVWNRTRMTLSLPLFKGKEGNAEVV